MTDFFTRLMPPSYSLHGSEIDRTILGTHLLMLALLVFWGVFFLYTLVRFRAGRNQKAAYVGIRSRWPIYSIALVAIIELADLFGLSLPAWVRWATPISAAEKPLELRVVGEQFAWNVHYPGPDGIFGRTNLRFVNADNPLGLDPKDPNAQDDILSLNELHLQVDRPVLIHITSKDVIHSFKLPVMRVEQDAIPGLNVPIHFTPIRTNNGEDWEIACAQLCGLGHYRMRGFLYVDTAKDLQEWLSEQDTALSALDEE
jgi:cytochrome c oxidase subunit II